jgi:transcriptional regulator with XRE-family HTH domain
MPISPDISKKLLEIKEDSGLTFKQIGDKVGSSEANVRRYIMGETKVPDKQLLYAIIRAMDEDPEEVLGKKKPEPQTPHIDHVMYNRQEQSYKEQLSWWAEHHREEIESLKAAYGTTIQSKDNWIDRLHKERNEAEEEIEKLEEFVLELKKEKKYLRVVIAILAAFIILFVLVYLIPDITNGDWGHIIYNAVAGSV